MKASRPTLLICLICCSLVLFLPVTQLQGAGFAMSDNFTVFTPDWPSPGEAKSYAEEVLKNAELWRRGSPKSGLDSSCLRGSGRRPSTWPLTFSVTPD